MKKIKIDANTYVYPLLLTMPDKSYWTVGEFAGKAWSIGKKLIK
jgi:hypothetical protein